jgi:hypothetical protein
LRFRDVENLLAERGIGASCESVRRWLNHFGPKIAADPRRRRPKPYTVGIVGGKARGPEGLDRNFIDAGFEWRKFGYSICMNGATGGESFP